MEANTKPTSKLSLRRLSRANLLLIAVLVVQIILAVAVYLPNTAAVEQSRGPLVANFQPENVTGLTIHDKDNGSTLVFTKTSTGEWVLPNADNYPISKAQITSLLGKIKALDTSRLIAQNRSSQSRLRVAPDAYERLIEIKQGDKVDKLYVGSSEGANAAHSRLNDQDTVYLTSGLTATDVSTTLASWVDTPYFTVNQSTITRMVVTNKQGSFEFNKGTNGWTWNGLPQGQVFKADKVTALLGQVANITLAAPLGKSDQDKYGMKSPLATVTVTTQDQVTVVPAATVGLPSLGLNGTQPPTPQPITKAVETTYTLTLGAKLESGNYALKSSQSPYFVEVTPTLAEAFTALARADLLIPPATAPATLPATVSATSPAMPQATTTVPTQPAAAPATVVATVPATLPATLPATAQVAPTLPTQPATTAAP